MHIRQEKNQKEGDVHKYINNLSHRAHGSRLTVQVYFIADFGLWIADLYLATDPSSLC